jgi:hypothetical protein
MAGLAALGVLVAGVVVSAVLFGVGHWFIGMMVLLGSLPVALVVWVTAKERM